MPHAIIECSENLSPILISNAVVEKAHAVMLKSGLFQPHAIKTRLHTAPHYVVGNKAGEGAFCHVLIYLMEGRSTEQKQALSEAMFNMLDAYIPAGASVTIDVRELDASMYRKR